MTLKNLLFPFVLSFFALGFGLETKAQDLIDYSNQWSFHNSTLAGTYHTRWKVDGDTAIGQFTYHKVYFSYYEDGRTWNYGGLYREAGEKGYRYQYNAPDKLIYDYTMEVGDSLNVGTGTYSYFIHVQSVGSRVVDGTLRKEITFDEGAVWVKGIGGNYSLLSPNEACFTACVYTNLKCVQKGNNVIYSSGEAGACDFKQWAWMTGQTETKNEALKIFPNPAQESLFIANALETDQYEVTDISGKVILQGYGNTVALTSLRPGVYFLVVDEEKPISFVKE